MPQLQFKGKQFVQNYHFTVPYRVLKPVPSKSFPKGRASLDDNLIIHGDNLAALKALLPKYAGQIKCIYIDPPYNTGNEHWVYSDNVNSPMMREWLGKEVGRDDLTRHDKWLCMMMPRLKLLRELLRDDGVIFVSIDDNEMYRLIALMEEVNFITDVIIWRKSGDSRWGKMKNVTTFRKDHEYIIVGYKNENIQFNKMWELPQFVYDYKNLDNDPRGPYKAGSISRKEEASNPNHPNYYTVISPTGKKFTRQWDISKEEFERLDKDKRIFWGKNGDNVPAIKIFLKEKRYVTPYSVFLEKGTTTEAKEELREIFTLKESEEDIFPNPKPHFLIETLIQLVTDKNSIILDSFAGSGTTGHAVLALNKEDGGNRKFILVEMEDYADRITAERVRRVIKGVPTAKDENLKNGLGGSFTFVELGEAIDDEGILSGKRLPSFVDMARYVFYTATGKNINEKKIKESTGFIGETEEYEVYLLYKPDLEWLKTTALDLEKAKKIAGKKQGKKKLVFAPAKYLDEEALKELNIEFAQLPFGIYRR